MSAQSELREAAKKVRETASAATPGPWEVNMLDHSYVNVSDDSAFETPDRHKAAWIALMNPDIAEHLAGWLELESHCNDMEMSDDAYLLARKILGRS